MNIRTTILTNNRCYREDGNIKVKGLMLHSVGCSQPSAEVFVKSWNNYNTACCVHAFVDANTGDVWQTLPWSHRAWHCGGRANDTHIGVEMCESDYIKYTNPSSGNAFTITDKKKAKAHAKKAYESAVELFAFLCKEYGLNPFADGVIISHCEGNRRGVASNHGDPEHYWNQLGTGYTMDGFRRDVAIAMGIVQAQNPVFDIDTVTGKEMVGRTNPDVIQTLGILAREDAKKSGILASITMAQAILESGYLHSELCVNANNIFGMKAYLSGNNWEGTAWDGVSVYSKPTNEEEDGFIVQIYSDFRSYPNLKASINDHSAYLANAKSGKRLRYDGIVGETNFRMAASLLKKGGYATDSRYVERLLSIYDMWDLGQYDVVDKQSAKELQAVVTTTVATDDGKLASYLVRVSIDDLRIRSGPGTQYDFRRYIPVGVYTIVETQGVWGRLKSGEGWICLDYVEKLEQ